MNVWIRDRKLRGWIPTFITCIMTTQIAITTKMMNSVIHPNDEDTCDKVGNAWISFSIFISSKWNREAWFWINFMMFADEIEEFIFIILGARLKTQLFKGIECQQITFWTLILTQIANTISNSVIISKCIGFSSKLKTFNIAFELLLMSWRILKAEIKVKHELKMICTNLCNELIVRNNQTFQALGFVFEVLVNSNVIKHAFELQTFDIREWFAFYN